MAEQQEITFTRVYDAPRELVWRAWTEPDRLARWWGTRGWSVDSASIEMDVRPGGAFRVTVVSDEDGTEMTTESVYREVVAPERLVAEEPAAGNWHEGAVNTLALTDLGDGRTQMDVHVAIQTTAEGRAAVEGGMTVTLDRLGDHLTAEHTTEEDR